jgi:hypothetical protein
VLTAVAVTAGKTPGDQVNLHALLPIHGTTADSWLPKYPPADCLDPRNDTGWSPNPDTDRPVHITLNPIEPIDAARTPYLTVQLNFGHGRGLIPQRIDLYVVTGNDDGSDLSTPERPSGGSCCGDIVLKRAMNCVQCASIWRMPKSVCERSPSRTRRW